MTEQSKPQEINAAEYVRASFDPSDRLAILVRNPKRSEIIQRITSAAKIIEPSFQEWLRFKNYQEFADIYIGMNPLKPQAHTRKKEDIQTIRHLYADFDHDGDASLASLEQSNLVPLPMSRRDVADYLGLTIETISRLLAKLERESVVRVLPRALQLMGSTERPLLCISRAPARPFLDPRCLARTFLQRLNIWLRLHDKCNHPPA